MYLCSDRSDPAAWIGLAIIIAIEIVLGIISPCFVA
jgi:hypothetical protein